jgi:hypothetical protein
MRLARYVLRARSAQNDMWYWPGHARRVCIALVLLLVLCSCAAPPPSAPPGFATPHCRVALHVDAAALLASLPGAGYDCAEEIALALTAQPHDATIAQLLALAALPNHSLARRNAVRALGRLAEQPAGSAANRLVRQTHAATVRHALVQILAVDRDTFVVQDAIWVLDTFFFPTAEALPQLQALTADQTRTPALRARAMNAASRLVLARPGRVLPMHLDFALRSLASDEPGVRARAALVVERLAPRLPVTDRALVIAALAEAHARVVEQPLVSDGMALSSLEVTDGLRFDPLFSGRPDVPATPLVARAAIARALDVYLPDGRFARLQAGYEALALNAGLEKPGLVIRAGLPPTELAPLAALVERTRVLFFKLLGEAFAPPVPGDQQETLTLLVFADQAVYRDYMLAFVGFGAEVDGVYVEERATLYTYVRTPAESRNTLEETVAHEVVHALTGRHVFAGHWRDASYHSEPKGWADEGLAEYLAGLALAEQGGAGGIADRRLTTICGRATPPDLAALLARRAGYDQFGHFAYEEAWALVRYLLEERRAGARAVFAAYRDGSYRQANVPALAGIASLGELEREWHAAIGRWCA